MNKKILPQNIIAVFVGVFTSLFVAFINNLLVIFGRLREYSIRGYPLHTP